jgi:hypothetical protein
MSGRIRRILLLLPAMLLWLAVFPHDFYISILTIRHDAERGRLHLTWRMTTHDVEHALEPEVQGRRLHLGTELELPQADSLVRAYVLDHLHVQVDGRTMEPEFIGCEVEMEDMYCYLLVDGVKEFQTLALKATLLFDMFDEQENVVHLEAGGQTRTHAFRNNSPAHTFTLKP